MKAATRHVKCPGCERRLRVPKSNSRDVQMHCKHCDTPFLASLMGHIDLEETQMTTSKNAAEAATKAKATAPTKKATSPTTATKKATAPASAPAKKATSAPAPVPSKKVKAEPGYKGHLKGSDKEKMHKFFDAQQKSVMDKFIARCERVGVKKSTASAWFRAFKKST